MKEKLKPPDKLPKEVTDLAKILALYVGQEWQKLPTLLAWIAHYHGYTRHEPLDEGDLKVLIHQQLNSRKIFSKYIEHYQEPMADSLAKAICSKLGTKKVELSEEGLRSLKKKLEGHDYLTVVREDHGWWIGYEGKTLEDEIAASGKTLEEAIHKLKKFYPQVKI